MKTDYIVERLQKNRATPLPPSGLKAQLEAVAMREARRAQRKWLWSVISLTGGALGLLLLLAVALVTATGTPVGARAADVLDVNLMRLWLVLYQNATAAVWFATAALWCAVGFSVAWLCIGWRRQSWR
ncbi:hypothetical protein [Alicyclobacillus mengziensis]|uniref:Uncharacterized protein n=1 Tax=Alicyclobacillus mengziensis TaxID=2931921 RepID=A0A9X7VWF2_9BACL|nr:hypothetical protein [Alicyclobacillus mengziensis]QSO45840.1 hypothetical protein JZ786_14980 [Alicyclobacillus mengziensis]